MTLPPDFSFEKVQPTLAVHLDDWAVKEIRLITSMLRSTGIHIRSGACSHVIASGTFVTRIVALDSYADKVWEGSFSSEQEIRQTVRRLTKATIRSRDRRMEDIMDKFGFCREVSVLQRKTHTTQQCTTFRRVYAPEQKNYVVMEISYVTHHMKHQI